MHIFAFAEKIAPAPIVQLVGEGLNKRLGTEGLTLNQIAIEAGKRGISLVIFLFQHFLSLTYSQLLNKMTGFIVMDQVMFALVWLQVFIRLPDFWVMSKQQSINNYYN